MTVSNTILTPAGIHSQYILWLLNFLLHNIANIIFNMIINDEKGKTSVWDHMHVNDLNFHISLSKAFQFAGCNWIQNPCITCYLWTCRTCQNLRIMTPLAANCILFRRLTFIRKLEAVNYKGLVWMRIWWCWFLVTRHWFSVQNYPSSSNHKVLQIPLVWRYKISHKIKLVAIKKLWLLHKKFCQQKSLVCKQAFYWNRQQLLL